MQPSCWERSLKCQCCMSLENFYLNATAMHKTAAAHWLVCSNPYFAQSFLTAGLIGAVILLCRFHPASILSWKMFKKRWWMQFFSERVFYCSPDTPNIGIKFVGWNNINISTGLKTKLISYLCVFFMTRFYFFKWSLWVVGRQCSFYFWFC